MILSNKKPEITKLQFIEPDYNGIAKVLAEFSKLYEVCENTDMLDELLKQFIETNLAKIIFSNDRPSI